MGLRVSLRRPAPLHGRETLLTESDSTDSPRAPPPTSRARGDHHTTADRLRDALSLAVIVGGIVLFFVARHNLQRLAANEIERVPGHRALEQAEHWDRLSRIGLWTAGGGLAMATAFSLLRRRRLQQPTSEP